MSGAMTRFLFDPTIWATGAFILLACLAIYRIYLHPLASFPGPKLAALTTWYEAYYDVILKGQYIFEIERMHRKYGNCPLDVDIDTKC